MSQGKIYYRASYAFPNCIINDDIEGAKRSIKECGWHAVTSSDIKNAACCGCMKCL